MVQEHSPGTRWQLRPAQRHPGVEITLTESDSASLLSALAAHRLDAAFTGLPGQLAAGIEAEIVADVALVAVVAPADPLVGTKTITVEALARRPLITLPQGTGLRTVIDRACASAGVQPRVAFEASDPHVLAELAGRGLGIAIVTEPAARAHRGQLRALTITRPRMRGRLALAWRAEGPTSPAARSFVSYARAVLTGGQGAASQRR